MIPDDPHARTRILNELDARPIPPSPAGDSPRTHWTPVWRPPLPVRARIEWETGAEILGATAHAYDYRDGAVYIHHGDPRAYTPWVWLPGRDITPAPER